jgi:hypothetical protein
VIRPYVNEDQLELLEAPVRVAFADRYKSPASLYTTFEVIQPSSLESALSNISRLERFGMSPINLARLIKTGYRSITSEEDLQIWIKFL